MGARLVKDINPSGSSSPNELISVNGLLFFTAETDPKASSDGGVPEESPSDDETNQNSDRSVDSEAETNEEETETSEEDNTSNATNPAEPSQTDTASGTGTVALMRSDGTAEGTTTLKTFDSVTNLVEAGDQLYFIAKKNDEYQLWTSDGTTRGTKQVKDLYPGADPRFPQDLFEIDGVLFYSAIDGTGDDGKYPYVNGYEVWRKEGNGVGSRFFRNLIPDKIITDIDISEEEETVLNPDGTPVQVPTGTNGDLEDLTRVVYTATVTTETFENDSFPQNFVGLNGNYFFTAQSSSFYSLDTRTDPTLIGGLELWFSDGTEAGTRPININQNTYTFYEPDDGEYTPADIVDQPDFGFFSRSSSSFPRELTPAQNELFFVANDGITGFELWSISDQGTIQD